MIERFSDEQLSHFSEEIGGVLVADAFMEEEGLHGSEAAIAHPLQQKQHFLLPLQGGVLRRRRDQH